MDHGSVIARGDARQLKRQIGGDQLLVVPVDPADLPRVAEIVGRVAGTAASVDAGTRRVTAPAAEGVAAIAALAAELGEAGVAVEDLGLSQPTLDDVFLTLTGAPRLEEAVR